MPGKIFRKNSDSPQLLILYTILTQKILYDRKTDRLLEERFGRSTETQKNADSVVAAHCMKSKTGKESYAYRLIYYTTRLDFIEEVWSFVAICYRIDAVQQALFSVVFGVELLLRRHAGHGQNGKFTTVF